MNDSFAHRLRLDQIREGERIDLTADEAERRSIADRLGLPSLARLEAHATFHRAGGTVRSEGRVVASLEQSCVVTGEPVPAHIDEPFDIAFVPEPPASRSAEEIELGTSDCDVVFHDGSTIDLGSAVADTLALGLNPYPRCAGAEASLKEAGVLTEAEASPFAALARWTKSEDS